MGVDGESGWRVVMTSQTVGRLPALSRPVRNEPTDTTTERSEERWCSDSVSRWRTPETFLNNVSGVCRLKWKSFLLKKMLLGKTKMIEIEDCVIIWFSGVWGREEEQRMTWEMRWRVQNKKWEQMLLKMFLPSCIPDVNTACMCSVDVERLLRELDTGHKDGRPFKPMRITLPAHALKKFSGSQFYFLVMRPTE